MAARDVGDKRAASAIAALRKPTRAAWVVNRLARADPGAPARLAALAAALRAAEQNKDGPRLRELSATRGPLIDELTARALVSASVADPPTSLRDEVAATLTAALADPATAADFATGTLTKAAHWSGFGAAEFSAVATTGTAATTAATTATAADADPDASTATTAADSTASQGVVRLADRRATAPNAPRQPGRAPRPRHPSRPTSAAASDQAGADLPADRQLADQAALAAARRAAAEQQRLARAAEEERRLVREAAERAAEQRKNYEDMERTVVSAATATAEAVAAEDRLEVAVRDLEERLTRAREELAATRRRARHAEAAERRARQLLDRVPRP